MHTHGQWFSRSFWLVTWLLVGTALGLEFSLDLSAEPVWHSIVVGVDILLVVGFASYLLQGALRERHNITPWIVQERINLIVLVLTLVALPAPRFAAGIVIARAIAVSLFNLLDTNLGRRLVSNINLRPSQTLSLGFLGVIGVSTTLLTFPAATVNGKGSTFLDALFTATSAACVVGLSVVDTGTYFTQFGQAVILATIQVGGLGIMMLSAAFAVMLGSRLHTRQQVGLSEIFDVSTAEGLKNLIRAVAAGTFLVEFFGALFLYIGWESEFASFGDAVWWSVFHSVAAFCNAGFGLAPDSLTRWVADPWICGVIMSLITIGGAGFFVLADVTNPQVWKILKPQSVWNRLQIQTRVVIIGTLVLNAFGLLIFLFLEYDGVLAGLSTSAKINAALFQTVSSRTAGFNTVSIGAIGPATALFMVVWMFIGASPGSTGGGIKTTTITVAIVSLRAMLTGRDEVELMGRRIPATVLNRALSIILTATMVIIVFLMFLTATQPLAFENLLFEVVSAFGTVGLTMDVTPKLDAVGRILIIAVMYIGRIGPLTMAMAIGERSKPKGYRFPEGQLAVG